MIDYSNIDKSIKFYESKGYCRIESPWTVSRYIVDLTKPKGNVSYELVHNNKCLVGSGEQSFLYLYLKGYLPLGRYVTCTPCFRDELFDEIRTKYFMKTELIITDVVNEEQLMIIINHSKEFFEKMLNAPVEIIKTDIGFDLEYQGVELGSYGIRETKFLKWIYGTGCAEPRLSYCQKI